MDTEMNDELHAERTVLRKKLTDSAMLALSPEAAEELARDFDALRIRLDAVVRSDAAGGEPPEGPIHTENHEVSLPEEAEKRAEEAEREGGSKEGRGRILLCQAAGFDGVNLTVPRVV